MRHAQKKAGREMEGRKGVGGERGRDGGKVGRREGERVGGKEGGGRAPKPQPLVVLFLVLANAERT